MGLLPDAISAGVMTRTWLLSDKKPISLLSDSDQTRAVMYAAITNPRWREKRSRQSRRMRHPQFYVSGKGFMQMMNCCLEAFFINLG